jgi:drug/metabolite transporter (DMT)-like permease
VVFERFPLETQKPFQNRHFCHSTALRGQEAAQMISVTSLGFGRLMIVLAVLFQAVGKVMFGTLLSDVPSTLFVLLSFGLTAALFLTVSRHGTGSPAWGLLLLLNASTALTFISFFYALKLIEPAIVGAVEIGIGPLLVVLLSLILIGQRPTLLQMIVCAGILCGCAVLALAALQGSGFTSHGSQAWLGLGASAAAGGGAVLITMTSKALLNRGWQFGAVLAHRFYLILPISLIMTLGTDTSAVEWGTELTAVLLAIAVIGVLAPLYLLQIGIGRCDPYTVMVTMSALPVLTFVIEGFSPTYQWSAMTAMGLGIVTGFLMLDIFAKRVWHS